MQRASGRSVPALPRPWSRAGTPHQLVSLPVLCAALACVALALLSVYRARLVGVAYGQYMGCERCLDLTVWSNDAFLMSGFTAILALSRFTSSRLVRIALAAFALAAILVYAADVLVFRLLSHRLLAFDVRRFVGDTPLLATVVQPLLSRPHGWGALAAALAIPLAATVAIVAGPASRLHALGWTALTVALLAFAEEVPRAQFLHQVAVRNVWQVNQWVDPTRPYSEAFWQQTRLTPGQALSCEAGPDQNVSVIVVVVESLSAYHSKLFSGLNDYTPNLDRLAKEGTYFSDFNANEYSTQGGLISLLTGFVPFPPAGSFISTMAYTEVEGDFHRWLRTEGYQTAFFTSGDLTLGERDRWLRAIGIEHSEGAENHFYDGMKRGSFGAADDVALVDRFLQWHAAERGKRPFMATLLTVATHPPFYSAQTGRMDEAASFREVDRQIGRLAAALESRGFFRDGLMLVVGDHRAMTPIPVAEQRRFGASAPGRVFALALGKTGLPPGESSAPLQQTDLIPSLRHLIGDHSCRNEWQGRLFGDKPEGARYVVRVDPAVRNEVVFEEGSSEYRLELDGDDTRWTTPPPRTADADRLRNEVNRERMERMSELRQAAR
jgi:lipoteichoic acid synthase